MKKLGSFLKRFVVVAICVYAIVTFFNQQSILNTYAANSKDLDKQIIEAKEQQEELNNRKNNITSNEYIEEIAREKLDMYLPNERVYISND